MYKRMTYRFRMLKMLLSFSEKCRVHFYLSFVFKIFIALLAFATPLLFSQFIEQVIMSGRFYVMLWIVLGYVAVYLLNAVFSYAVVYCNDKLINHVTLGVKAKILDSYFKREFAEYDTIDSGYMKTRMEDDTVCIEKYFTSQSVDYIISLFTLVVATVLLLFIEWRLALFAVISIPATIVIDYAVAKKEAVVQNASRQNNQKNDRMATFVHAGVAGDKGIEPA